MARDPLLVKRNVFVIAGGLVAFYSLLAILYVALLRIPGDACVRGELMVGGCRGVLVVLGPPLVIGLGILLFGALRFRAPPASLEDRLHYGTGTHVLLTILGSLVGVSALALVYVTLKERALEAGQYIAVEAGGMEYLFSFVLKLLLLLSVVAFLIAIGMYLVHGGMRRAFIAAAEALEAETVVAEEEKDLFYDDEAGPLGPPEGGEPDVGSGQGPDQGSDEGPDPRTGETSDETSDAAAAPEPWREAMREAAATVPVAGAASVPTVGDDSEE